MTLEQLGAQRPVRRVGLQADRQAGPCLGAQVAERYDISVRFTLEGGRLAMLLKCPLRIDSEHWLRLCDDFVLVGINA